MSQLGNVLIWTKVDSLTLHTQFIHTLLVYSPVPVNAPELTFPNTANAYLDDLKIACHKSVSKNHKPGFSHNCYCFYDLLSVSRSGSQGSLGLAFPLAPIPAPRVGVVEVQLVPASVPRLTEAPFIPAPVPAPWVGMAGAQSLPMPPRVSATVPLPTPAPVSVPRVEAAEAQLAPAPTLAPRLKAARAQLVLVPVSVPWEGMAGV